MALSMPASTKTEVRIGDEWIGLPTTKITVSGGELVMGAPKGVRTDMVLSVGLTTWLPNQPSGKTDLRMTLPNGAVIVHAGEIIEATEREIKFKVASTARL